MRSYWIKATATGTELEEREIPIPEPTAGQLLVRVRAAGLNRGEFITRRDLHAGATEARPAGTESAGQVVAVGNGVSRFAVGDRVMATVRGSFAEYVVVDAELALEAPSALSWDEAGCSTLVFMVAHDMLVTQGALRPGEWVLVAGASSGVGVATVQTAAALRARTIGTAGSAAKLERLHRVGLNVGLETRGPDFCAGVMAATEQRGADIAVNSVGGTVFAECLRSLAYEGRLAVVGYVDGVLTSTLDISRLHANRLKVYGVSATGRDRGRRLAAVRAFERDMLPFFRSGALKPLVDRSFDFAELPAAKSFMESNAHVGKIALRGTKDA